MAILAFGRNRQARAKRDEDTLAVERWQTDGGRRIIRLIGVSAGLLIWVVALVSGCALDGKQESTQDTRQQASPKTEQASAAQGNTYVNVWMENGPETGKARTPQGPPTSQPSGIAAMVAQANSGKDANGTGTVGATYAQAGNTVNVYTTTGGVTPTQTGTTTGTATQTATQTPTNTPTQHVEPKTSASIPVAVALPGGNNSQQSNAAQEGQVTATKSDQISQQYTRLQAERDLLRELIAERNGRLDMRPTTQPSGALTPDQMEEDIKKLMREKAALQAELDASKKANP